MILLRHGQSQFNAAFTQARRDPGIVDAPLTGLGHDQAQTAAQALAEHRIGRIIASPYTRALQTAAPIARRLGLPVEVSPLIRERFKFACDIGTPRSALAEAWPRHDFAAVDELWWPHREEGAEAVIARAACFRAAMAALDDHAETLVISHWGFILAMTGDSVMNGEWLHCDPTDPPPETVIWQVRPRTIPAPAPPTPIPPATASGRL